MGANDNMSIVAVMGRPGSGKTTVSEYIRDRLEFEYVYPGQLARQEAERDQEFAGALRRGKMAPREKMNDMMVEQIIERAPRVVLDGYPRYMEQVADLLHAADVIPVWIVVVATPEETCKQREVERGRGDESAVDHRHELFESETQPAIRWFYRRMPNRVIVMPGDDDPDHNSIWLEEIMDEAYR